MSAGAGSSGSGAGAFSLAAGCVRAADCSLLHRTCHGSQDEAGADLSLLAAKRRKAKEKDRAAGAAAAAAAKADRKMARKTGA